MTRYSEQAFRDDKDKRRCDAKGRAGKRRRGGELNAGAGAKEPKRGDRRSIGGAQELVAEIHALTVTRIQDDLLAGWVRGGSCLLKS